MPETKEWTLMFYLASDNPLAPSIVSQLKALKNAGFHSEANVIRRDLILISRKRRSTPSTSTGL